MARKALSVELKGFKEVRQALHKIPEAIFNRVVRKALTAGARPCVRKMKDFAPVADSDQTTHGIPIGPGRGLLKKSIGSRVRVTRSPTRAYAVIGPRRKFNMMIGMAFSVKQPGGTPVYMKPTKYAHLMERGHDIRLAGGRKVGHFEGTKFAERAYDASVRDAQTVMEGIFESGIAEQARKLAAV